MCIIFTNWSNCCYRKRGIIVNVSSSSALNPTPLLTVYAASKVMDNMTYLMYVNTIDCGISFLLGIYGLFHFSSSICVLW